MKWKMHTLKISLITFLVLSGFSVIVPNVVISSEQQDVKTPVGIESVVASGEGSSAELTIRLTSPATYTSYKTASPLRLVIDFSQVTQGNISAPIVINRGNFKTVTASRFDTDAGVLTRMEIELVSDSEAVISTLPARPNELIISFPQIAETAVTAEVAKPVEKPVIPANTQPAVSELISVGNENPNKTLTGISVNKNVLLLEIDGAINEFKTFRLNKPERFVVDLLNVKSGLASRLVPLNASGVASARIGLYPDKVRVVFDAVGGTFPEAIAAKNASGVQITLGDKSAEENANTKLSSVAAAVSSEDKSTPISKTPEQVGLPEAIKPAIVNQVLPDKKTPAAIKPKTTPGLASIEMIDFQALEGISRISVKVNGEINVDTPVKSAGYVTFIIKNSILPKNLQRSLETRSFVSPVLRITPLTVKNKKSTDTKIRVATRVAAPFELRQEGDMLYLEFKHPAGLSGDLLLNEASAAKNKPIVQKPVLNREDEISSDLTPAAEPTSKPNTLHTYKGRKVTLEFADAEVRKIFQLLSEVSNKNFVLGDEVTGAISLKLVNVPWDQALDIILDTKGLDKREDGNIILIKGKGKFRSQAEEDLDLKKTQLKNEVLYTEYFPVNYSKSGDMKTAIEGLITANTGKVSVDERTNTLIITAIKSDIERIKTYLAKMDVPERQVMIEARIVEASSSFTRNLGVSWGAHYRDGSASFLGINQMDNSFGGLTNPSVTSGQSGVAGTNMGISFGRLASNIQLDMRLNAAATAGLIKIVSTPKIATLNNKTAKITQGQSIPYQNTTSTTGATTQFVQAVLSLEVKPHINANGTIGMEIKATNNSPGSGSPPPINTKEATTEMLLKDGETTVIGGIYKEDDTQSEEGVPFLMDIPFLGRLFKSTAMVKTKSELLIFITPRILN
ncbi:MAG: type IV pilus secretin PilQ [Desulfuromonadaceae bacterium]|nr:type IV pilus secretin PilQ [Desulfuromonadaceae bacterium]